MASTDVEILGWFLAELHGSRKCKGALDCGPNSG
jgi:hypothetical protein